MDFHYRALRRLALVGTCWLPALAFSCKCQAQPLIDQKQLQENIQVGQIARLSTILKRETGTVCVLLPYQNSLPESDPHSAPINAYLAATRYQSNEGHWALVFVDGDAVNVARFNRSETLDVDSGDPSLPKGFRPTKCAEIAHAGIAKVAAFGRIRLVLGELE